MTHFIERCSSCDTVISQCRCPSESKVLTHSVCEVCKLKAEAHWTTADGKKIPYRLLPDDHFNNIINDGYRNPQLMEEAARRGTRVPGRPIDRLDPMELLKESMMFLEACASCAIEGNAYGAMVSGAWENNRGLFYHYLNLSLEERLTNDDDKADK